MSTESKVGGFRKAGIAVAAITALTLKDDIDLSVAIVVGVIAIVGVLAQAWIDGRNNDKPAV